MSARNNRSVILTADEQKTLLESCVTVKGDTAPCDFADKVIRGDAFEVMPLLGKGFADLLIADPPYNLSKEYDGDTFYKQSGEAYRDYTERWLKAALPLLKPNASVYVCCDWRTSLIIGDVLQKYLIVRNRITWQREKGRGAAKNWKNSMEDIWFATVSDRYTFRLDAVRLRRKVIAPYRENGKPKDWEETDKGNFRDTCPSNFWNDVTVPFWSMPENTEHPAQKPEKLLAKLILASSNENDIIFDPFLGSGSTAVTAKKLSRRFVGIEKSPRYCALCQKRLMAADTDKTIQGYEDGVFWERNANR